MSNNGFKPNRWIESVNCAIEGVLWAARTQRHMRYHFLAALAVLLVALFLRVTALDFVLLALAVTLVLLAELINTALEVVVDLISPQYHPLARRAKDVAAGAVLVASVGAAVIGYLALARYVFPAAGEEPGGAPPPGELAVVSVLIVTILVVMLKARFGRGTPLYGGMPSGHAAVAFAIATAIILSGTGAILSILAVAMAAMVSHSRLLLEVHSLKEVLVGAALGSGTTLVIYLLFA